MLVAALVRLAFDVQVDPTGGGVAVGGSEGLDGVAGGPGIGDGGLIERDAFEPCLAFEGAAGGDGEEDGVLRTGGGELEGEAGPRVCAGDGFGVDVEGHRRHRESGAGGDGRAVGVADGEVLGTHPAGEFVALADGEGDRGGANLGVGVLAAGFDAEGLGRGVMDVGVCGGGAVDDGQLIKRCLIDGGGGVRSDGDQTKNDSAHGGPSWEIRIPELGFGWVRLAVENGGFCCK